MRFKTLTIFISLSLFNVLTVAYANPLTHQVQKGDTLSSLAQQYLGSASRWREIWAANPTLRNPDQIIAGIQISIPTTRAISTGQGLNPSLDNYGTAASEFINSGHIEQFTDHRVLIRQGDLNQQLHVSAIDQSTDRLEIIASSIQLQQATNYLVIRENQRHPTVSGDIIEARIIGHATTNHTGSLKTLTVNNLAQPLQRDEITVIADYRILFSRNNIQLHSPNMSPTAEIIQVLHNEPNGLYTVIESSVNQTIQPGGIVRYRNPGTSNHSYDGVLLVISSIQGASYAAVLSAKAPPMPTASVF